MKLKVKNFEKKLSIRNRINTIRLDLIRKLKQGKKGWDAVRMLKELIADIDKAELEEKKQ